MFYEYTVSTEHLAESILLSLHHFSIKQMLFNNSYSNVVSGSQMKQSHSARYLMKGLHGYNTLKFSINP